MWQVDSVVDEDDDDDDSILTAGVGCDDDDDDDDDSLASLQPFRDAMMMVIRRMVQPWPKPGVIPTFDSKSYHRWYSERSIIVSVEGIR